MNCAGICRPVTGTGSSQRSEGQPTRRLWLVDRSRVEEEKTRVRSQINAMTPWCGDGETVGMTLSLSDISKNYGRRYVLRNVDAEFPIGLTLLVGPSGSGKSTLLRLIATAEKPSTGLIAWNGEPLPAARRKLRETLGYAPQAVELPDDLTAREFADHIAALKGLDAKSAGRQFAAVADVLGIHSDNDRLIGAFSGGMRRRLIFAQALLGEPGLLAIDEPTAELDADSAALVSSLILEPRGHQS